MCPKLKKGEKKYDKCYFCHKPRHSKKIAKNIRLIKKKDKLSAFTWFELNLAKVPYNTCSCFITIQIIKPNKKFIFMET